MAPEMIDRKPYDFKVDVWSAAIIIYTLLVGKLPYDGNDFNEVGHLHKTTSPLQVFNDLDLDVSESGVDFLTIAMCTNCNERASVEELLNHKWLEDVPLPVLKTKGLSKSSNIA